MIREAIGRVVEGDHLAEGEMQEVMEEIMTGRATPTQIAAFITAMRMKGETVEEITGAARVMRAKARRVRVGGTQGSRGAGAQDVPDERVLDTCGTGGDGSGTFNVSTATALVAAGGGVRVAKHGNRAVSSRCGSADVLAELGVRVDIPVADAERCIREIGIGFLYAPLCHEAMRYAALPRREIGLRTLFNLLGPLTNPAGVSAQVLGVYEAGLTEKVARVLGRLGTLEAFVVCGEGVYDEISICGPTRVSHLKGESVETFELKPEDLGLKRRDPSGIRGGGPPENARIIRGILEGQEGPCKDMVLLNAAAAFVAAGLDTDLRCGMERAREAIGSGKARLKLEALIRFTNGCGRGEGKPRPEGAA
ncbi:MAG: anthranilate phosphoribosyltransferase [Deltaproteobacteria bacterium]|nr:anthranilate phosphoribosyltransferase [Deltaproteobacteria bacterium]MBW1922043.1 anthranilate phosphoribosyltransferase [Deltaproteobacteria bacterium]MBW1949860.1 anthranilate phosphoribosyltransferase [Deltaproteobacteria bacterium]MBW2348177.1 anthranilate phosphoribosyltransferase [Deltaproteobacteria bacterium]RLB37650.1 MAG: anthranilate phosphoribosyltransferase [Deltaproteobacteria bacterium]